MYENAAVTAAIERITTLSRLILPLYHQRLVDSRPKSNAAC